MPDMCNPLVRYLLAKGFTQQGSSGHFMAQILSTVDKNHPLVMCLDLVQSFGTCRAGAPSCSKEICGSFWDHMGRESDHKGVLSEAV
jgi:hypothetical protein